jgi:ribosome-associated protein
MQALHEDLSRMLRERGISILGTEGTDGGSWGLVDCGGFVVHLFNTQARTFYDLDMIWGDVPRIAWQDNES